MRASAGRVLHLGIKELRSLRSDPVMAILILYTFTIAIYTVAMGAKFEVRNAAVAVVDEDRSALSERLTDTILPPYFKTPVAISAGDIDRAMDTGRFVFVVTFPPDFERDALAGRRPTIALDVDATAMSQAGNGAAYLQAILLREAAEVLPDAGAGQDPVSLVVRAMFNPNLDSTWFSAVMQVINNVTMLSVILAGAALIREREHGTIEHLLVMPVRPMEIMLAKAWANGLVMVAAATLSLIIVVEGVLAVPIAGSLALFVGATIIYQFSVTALGILLATFSASMAQFGLLAIPVLVAMNLLSGATTPLESMPDWLRLTMQTVPSTQFVEIAQSILYRGAGLSIIWPQLLALAAIGAAYFALAELRFRKALLSVQ